MVRMDKETILIFANGEIENPEWVRPMLARARATIAADGGVRYLLALGCKPDVLIGDLDSLPEGLESELGDWHDSEIIRYPVAKNETDLELALLYAADRYPGAKLIILGGFGGRLDQTLANILLLAHPALADCTIRMEQAGESAWLVADETRFEGRPGDRVSLIPMGGSVHVVQTTGLRWPLEDEVLEFGPARGISNEMTAKSASVTLNSGLLLCIQANNREDPQSG
jgi:thiamine pyrophosphokinase